jgi:lipopolysaccharide transport system ATP-binding protein
MRAPTAEAVDYYMTSEMARSGERSWSPSETGDENPFNPGSLRVVDNQGRVVDRVSSIQPFTIELEYELEQAITGLRVGLYLYTSRGEPVFTTFDTDEPTRYENLTDREAGRYISRCRIPANFLNGGTFVLGVNASSFQIRSYFTDEHALTFSVDPTGAPGSHWAEPRRGPMRPALEWEVAEAVR